MQRINLKLYLDIAKKMYRYYTQQKLSRIGSKICLEWEEPNQIENWLTRRGKCKKNSRARHLKRGVKYYAKVMKKIEIQTRNLNMSTSIFKRKYKQFYFTTRKFIGPTIFLLILGENCECFAIKTNAVVKFSRVITNFSCAASEFFVWPSHNRHFHLKYLEN